MVSLITGGTIASHGLLAVNLLSPDLIKKFSPTRDLTNVLAGSTLVGGTLYFVSSPYFDAMKCVSKKYLYSFFGSIIFTSVSVIFWIFCDCVLPKNNGIRATVALVSSLALFPIGTDFLDNIGARKNEQGKKPK